jgi:hypothetical protein
MPTPNHFAPVILYSEDAKAVHDALISSGHLELANIISERAQRTDSDRRYANALELPEEGTFEMDDTPVVSSSEDGAFVMVWQWVDAESAEI